MRQPVAIKAKPFPVLFETEKESVQNRPPVKRTTLTFKDPAKEAAFNNYATFRSLPFIRLSIVLAIGLYCVFAFLDPIITPAMVTEITIIRVISILFFGLILYLSFTDWGYKNLQFMMGIVVLFASCGIIAMILLTEASGGYLYYAALILAIIYAHNLLRLRFIYATLTTWIVILFYASATVWLQTTPFHIYLNNMFFLVSANILGMSASY